MRGEYVHASVDISEVSTKEQLAEAFTKAVARVAGSAMSQELKPVWNKLSVRVNEDNDDVRDGFGDAVVLRTYHTLDLSVLAVK